MPLAQGSGFISMADYINGNQDAINASRAGVNADETKALDQAGATTEADISSAAKNTPAAINAEMSAASGQDNDAAYKAWEQSQAKGGYYTPGGTGDPSQNPYNTAGKNDAATRSFLAGAPGDQFGGQKVETDLSNDANTGAQAANLANWGGVFDAMQQKHGGAGYGDAGAAFDANAIGTGGFADVAARGKGFAEAESGKYDKAISDAGQTPYDTSGASYTPTGYRTSGGQEYTQNPDNPQDRGGAPSKQDLRPFGPTYSSNPNEPNYPTETTTAGNPVYGNPPNPVELNPSGGGAPTKNQNGVITGYAPTPNGAYGANVDPNLQRNEGRTAKKINGGLPMSNDPAYNPYNWGG